MQEIFLYDDYVILLKDFYQKKKSTRSRFSYEYLSEKLGSTSKGFARNLFTGERTLTPPYAKKLAKIMELTREEAHYFYCLVEWNQADTIDQKNELYKQLVQIRSTSLSYKKSQILSQKQFKYYSEFHHSVIRAILDIVEFTDDYKWLAKRVYPNITPGKAKWSVKLLLELGLVKRDRNGVCRVTEKSIVTGPQIKSQGILNSHILNANLALQAMKDLSMDERFLQGNTLGISKRSYDKICEVAQTFRRTVANIAVEDKQPDAVYRLNLHLFPVSDRPIRKKV